ncbi:MAG: hypothetical protein O210_OD1C00001G0058 [Parcubacteria bacterium RAAC4_OD1_1]|nr:MAG: hypothetical protein O210_OD1C00001G0058 [Parcubacteria bacterium RAAC4_OD1_1]
MENLKSILFSIIIIGVIGGLGYWAFSSIESGSEHSYNEEIQKLKDTNRVLEEEIFSLKEEIRVLNLTKEEDEIKEEIKVENPKTEEPKTEITNYKYQDMISSIQGLVDRKVNLKLGSKGVDVGVVQKFLNIYNGTSKRIDNDFGAGTVTLVKDFQKDIGLTADGEVGSTTLNKMINWLKNQK